MSDLIERLRAETSEERREEILTEGWDTAVRSLYDEIKRTGEHGDYQRLIFESWIIDGKDELLNEAADDLTASNERLNAAVEDYNNALAEIERLKAALNDPIAVHLNMLRGGIAKPSIANIVHLYGREAIERYLSDRLALGETK